MLNLITKGIAKVFGTKADRDLKELLPYVDKVNAVFPGLASLSDEALRQRSQALKATIRERLASIDEQIAALKGQLDSPQGADINTKEKIFGQIDSLEKERNKNLELVLDEILPEAFALIKETARRLSQNQQLRVTATDWDRELAARKSNVVIEGDEAIWANRWNAAGSEIVWDMVHYDVQVIGGVVLHKGKISEMATGEGKTLVATFPAFLNGLAGNGVHIVTVNDYLAKRDSEWMGPLFEFHGLRVDCIDKHEPNSPERRRAYEADITYGTNNEFGFDYLRDNMTRSPEELVQRKLHYAMVDEVDSVLIDDARTPLIISGPMSRGEEQDFEQLKPLIASMVEAQKALVSQYLVDAKKKLAAGNEKEGGLDLFRAYRGLPKSKPLIKFLSETGNRAILQKTENIYLADNQKLMPEADKPLYFTIEEKNNQIDITGKGIDFLAEKVNDGQFFILPDMSTALDSIEKDSSLSEEERLTRKDQLINDYTEKSRRIHTLQQLLKAYTLFEKEVEYVIIDGKVKIVDEQTGRIMEGRRYSDGLHQAIEAKENVKVEEATQTYATVTLQNYFRMYHKLAGMTGTAETEAGEFWSIYKLDVVVIPTNRAISRKDQEDKVYKTVREKYNAVVEEISSLTQAGRPVLVGTTSVENSEILSRMLKLRGIKHNVLNAKYHQQEAQIVAEAGKPSTVTIATNMAGRGTDIKLTPESKASGGLAIIGTERHESRRVDRQLRGRSGRQGDPGTSQFFVSLEDNLMRLFGSDRIIKIMDRMGLEEGEVIQHSMITSSIERAQKKVEENHFSTRKRLLEYDDVMNSQREVVYRRRRNALFGERLELDLMNIVGETCELIITRNKQGGSFEDYRLQVLHYFGHIPQAITEAEFAKAKPQELVQKLFREMYQYYTARTQELAQASYPGFQNIAQMNIIPADGQVIVPTTDGKRFFQVQVGLADAINSQGAALVRTLEQSVVLGFIDRAWIDHLREMDDLKQSVQNAVFEQKDPLLIYKFESLTLFKQFVGKVNEEILTYLFKWQIYQEEVPQPVPQAPRGPLRQAAQTQRQEVGQAVAEAQVVEEAPAPRPQPIRAEKEPNRNDRVTVRYMNGELRRDVKFKTVEEDIRAGRCLIVDLA